MLLVGFVILFFIGLSKRMGPADLILDYFQKNLAEAIHTYGNMGLDHEKSLKFEEFSKVLIDILTKIYPSLLVVGTGFVVWVNIMMSKTIFRIGKLQYPDFSPIDRWRSPDYMVWAVIAAGFSLFFPIAGIKWFALNVLIVMLMIYVFHGLSILLFFFNKFHIPRWIRIGIYFLIIIQQFFLLGLAMLGLFDQWIDFRKIYHRRASS
jgi:uncharacterized protein YybS (DUF2232 family)